MAHFRGTVKGARGEASRLGHKATGMHVEAQSWQGKVVVELESVDGVDRAYVYLTGHPYSNGIRQVLYEGPVAGGNIQRWQGVP